MSPDSRLHRSYLYAPGTDARVMGKALAAGADAVVLDLEDAVPRAEKGAARRTVAALLAGADAPSDVHVRINRTPDGFDHDDAAAVVCPRLRALRLPKTEAADHVRDLDAALVSLEDAAGMPHGTVRLYPTLESARGVVALQEILGASARIERVAFGATDFLADIAASGDDDLATLHARSTVVLTSRAAGVGPPVDSVHTDLGDDEGLRQEALRARSLGFFGKSIIHPRQIPVVHAVFTPTADDIAWAERVVAALHAADVGGRGAVVVEGTFVDAAVAARARAVLALREAVRGNNP